MATFNEVQYMIFDELKLGSDDSIFNTDHILFLMKNFRAALLKQKYTDAKRDIPESNFQTVPITVSYSSDCITGEQVKSTTKVPFLINLNGLNYVDITPSGDRFNNLEFTLVPRDRFKYIGEYNKWLRKIVYYTISSDNYLYLKSMNTDFKYLKCINVVGMFDDPVEAAKMSTNNCNYMDTNFPLENSLVATLVDMVVKEMEAILYNKSDQNNDGSDAFSNDLNNN